MLRRAVSLYETLSVGNPARHVVKERMEERKKERKVKWGQKHWTGGSNIRQSDSALKLFIMGGEHFTL